MKKLLASALTLTLSLGLLAGCSGTAVVQVPGTPAPAPAPTPVETSAPAPGNSSGEAVKTGLFMLTTVAKSKDAAADAEGLAQANVDLVAVTVGDDGVIDACVIDAIQSKIGFDAAGKLTTPLDTVVPSKNELGANYGMGKASSIGKEWDEQLRALADYVVGKTLDEVKRIAVQEDGTAGDADLAATITLSIADYLEGIEKAVENAVHLGAHKGDKLALTTSTNIAKSKDATAEADGLAQAYATVAAVTLNGDTVTSCTIDAVQANVNFDAAGKLTTDTSIFQPSKNELGANYGMKEYSGIGREWDEQAAAFCAYVTGKSLSDVAGIAVNDHESPTDADLAASVTIGIGEFQALIAKAGA